MPCWISGDQMSPSATAATKAEQIKVSFELGLTATYTLTLNPSQAKRLVEGYREPGECWEDVLTDCLKTFTRFEIDELLTAAVAEMLQSTIKLKQLPVAFTIDESSVDVINEGITVEVG